MKNYMVLCCLLGIFGCVFAIVIGFIFIIEGIKFSDSKGFLIGVPAILASSVGLIICIALIKKTKG